MTPVKDRKGLITLPLSILLWEYTRSGSWNVTIFASFKPASRLSSTKQDHFWLIKGIFAVFEDNDLFSVYSSLTLLYELMVIMYLGKKSRAFGKFQQLWSKVPSLLSNAISYESIPPGSAAGVRPYLTPLSPGQQAVRGFVPFQLHSARVSKTCCCNCKISDIQAETATGENLTYTVCQLSQSSPWLTLLIGCCNWIFFPC